MVDTLGLMMAIVVHAASIQDYDGAKLVFQELGDRFKRLLAVFADSAYSKMGLPDWVKSTFGWPKISTFCKRSCDRWESRAL